MFDTFLHIFKTLTDKTTSWVAKTFTFLVFLFAILFANNTLDFIHNYRTSHKLEHLEKIKQLLSDTTLNTAAKKYLVTERNYIIQHRSTLDYITDIYESLSFHNSFIARTPNTNNTVTIKENPKSSINPQEETVSIPVKNYWLHFLFSNFWLIFFVFLIPYSLKNSKISFGINLFAITF
jgi:hypothetical protein